MKEFITKPTFLTESEQVQQKLHDAFGVQKESFERSVTVFYLKHRRQDITVTRQQVIRHVGDVFVYDGATPQPRVDVLLQSAVDFTSTAAVTMSDQHPRWTREITKFWGDVTTAIISAEKVEEVDGAILRSPITIDNRIHNNRATRDRALRLYNEQLVYPSMIHEQANSSREERIQSDS